MSQFRKRQNLNIPPASEPEKTNPEGPSGDQFDFSRRKWAEEGGLPTTRKFEEQRKFSTEQAPALKPKPSQPFSERVVTRYEFEDYLKGSEARSNIRRELNLTSEADVNDAVIKLKEIFKEADVYQKGKLDPMDINRMFGDPKLGKTGSLFWKHKAEMDKLYQQHGADRYKAEKEAKKYDKLLRFFREKLF